MTSTQQPATHRSSHPKRYPPGVPDIVWAPLAAAILMLVVGLLGLLAHQPLKCCADFG